MESFIPILRNAVNDEIIQIVGKDKEIYAHFARFLNYEDLEDRMEMKYKNKDDLVGEWIGLTNTGVVSMIKRVGILEENENALPWY